MRVVVLGGYGNFGARICRALARDDVEVIAASRDPDRGHRAAGFDAKIGKARIDLSDPQLASRLRKLSPHTVIHCAGPFQAQDYRVAFASIEAGAHYIDLADGRSFVAQFAQQADSRARAAGCSPLAERVPYRRFLPRSLTPSWIVSLQSKRYKRISPRRNARHVAPQRCRRFSATPASDSRGGKTVRGEQPTAGRNFSVYASTVWERDGQRPATSRIWSYSPRATHRLEPCSSAQRSKSASNTLSWRR